MLMVDNDEAIRDRAYDLWERAGRPSGQEHVHWAEAKRQIEAAAAIAISPAPPPARADAPAFPEQPAEVIQLRSALYAPEPFSFELFGDECPKLDLPILVRAA